MIMNRIYAETLISNQPSWLNFSNNTCLSTPEASTTQLLSPISERESNFSIELIVFQFTIAGNRWYKGFDSNTRRNN